MKFFSFIGNFFKKIAKKVIGFFKGKNPVDAINDTTKTVVGVATAGVTVFAAVNLIRAHMMPSNRTSERVTRAKRSGAEYMMDQREAGSVESKLANAKLNTSSINQNAHRSAASLKQTELDMLAEIAETRNAYFKELSPEQQMEVLNMEGFDFEAFKEEKREVSRSPFRAIKEESLKAANKPFREEKDYGIFNFIMHPLSNFYHWLINDPIPKKVPQIHLINLNEIPKVPCETAFDAVDAAQALSSYLDANKKVGIQYTGRTQAEAIEQQILIDEAFRHESLDDYNHAVNRRLKASMATPTLYALLGDEREGRRLDEERERRRRADRDRDRDRSDRRRSSVLDDDDGDYGDYEDRELRRRSSVEESDADRKAQELIDYHMQLSHRGVIDRTGFSFKL